MTPSPLSAVIVEHCHGAIARVAPDATAFGLRSNPYHLEILGFWDPAKEDAANLAWVERLFADMKPFNAGEVYVNSLDEGEGHRVCEAYGINYARLVMLKKPNSIPPIFSAAITISLPGSRDVVAQPEGRRYADATWTGNIGHNESAAQPIWLLPPNARFITAAVAINGL
jgi:hypothetical protein